MPRTASVYFSDEFLGDLEWAKTEFPKENQSAILQKALHEMRNSIEGGRIDKAAGGIPANSRTTAQDYYRKKLDFTADYRNDTDIIVTIGRGRLRDLLIHIFDEIERERPQYLALCEELLKQEHPRLYKIWKT